MLSQKLLKWIGLHEIYTLQKITLCYTDLHFYDSKFFRKKLHYYWISYWGLRVV